MSFARRLIHWVGIVTPAQGNPEDPDDLDDHGNVESAGPDAVTIVRALIQPRTVEEIASISQAGLEVSDHIVFMSPRRIPPSAYFQDADADGILPGGRRFEVLGVRSFEFGRSPHLEIDVRSFGETEGAAVGS